MLAILPLEQSVHLVQIEHVLAGHFDEPIEHVDTEFGHSLMMCSSRSGDGLCQFLLLETFLDWLGEQQFLGTTLFIDQIAHPTCHVVLKTADEGRHAYGWAE